LEKKKGSREINSQGKKHHFRNLCLREFRERFMWEKAMRKKTINEKRKSPGDKLRGDKRHLVFPQKVAGEGKGHHQRKDASHKRDLKRRSQGDLGPLPHPRARIISRASQGVTGHSGDLGWGGRTPVKKI